MREICMSGATRGRATGQHGLSPTYSTERSIPSGNETDDLSVKPPSVGRDILFPSGPLSLGGHDPPATTGSFTPRGARWENRHGATRPLGGERYGVGHDPRAFRIPSEVLRITGLL